MVKGGGDSQPVLRNARPVLGDVDLDRQGRVVPAVVRKRRPSGVDADRLALVHRRGDRDEAHLEQVAEAVVVHRLVDDVDPGAMGVPAAVAAAGGRRDPGLEPVGVLGHAVIVDSDGDGGRGGPGGKGDVVEVPAGVGGIGRVPAGVVGLLGVDPDGQRLRGVAGAGEGEGGVLGLGERGHADAAVRAGRDGDLGQAVVRGGGLRAPLAGPLADREGEETPGQIRIPGIDVHLDIEEAGGAVGHHVYQVVLPDAVLGAPDPRDLPLACRNHHTRGNEGRRPVVVQRPGNHHVVDIGDAHAKR